MIERLSQVSGADVSRETYARLERFAALLIEESGRQNLVSAASLPDLWERHLVDGAQLLTLAGKPGSWCDIGSGAGLPGMVIAILSGQPMTLIEPRRLRCEFLQTCVDELALTDVNVVTSKAANVTGRFDYITARAVARLDALLAMTAHLAHNRTRFILPKGKGVKSELDEARRNWQGEFRLVPSQTHPDAAIVVADGVRPGKKS